MTATKIQPGNDTHLTLLMAPHSLNFVTGADRAALLAYGRDVFAAARASQCLAQIQEPPATPGTLVKAVREYLGVHPDITLGGHTLDDMALDLARIALGAGAAPAAVAPALEAPAAPVSTYVEVRECSDCGHVGINDTDGSKAACNTCDWQGDSPREDKCPGCNRVGTMTSACPECGARTSLIAETHLLAAAPQAPAAPSVDEREAFEAFMREDTSGFSLNREGESYEEFEVATYWHFWKARAALTMPTAAPAAPAVDAPAERDAAFEAVRNRLCALQRYSFVLDDDGVVRRAQDRTGNWIEFDDAHALFDPVAVDSAIAAQAKEGGAA